eukprot:SAG22_NODE_19_length_32182_cov_39.206963_27_plen_75_part_01
MKVAVFCSMLCHTSGEVSAGGWATTPPTTSPLFPSGLLSAGEEASSCTFRFPPKTGAPGGVLPAAAAAPPPPPPP